MPCKIINFSDVSDPCSLKCQKEMSIIMCNIVHLNVKKL